MADTPAVATLAIAPPGSDATAHGTARGFWRAALADPTGRVAIGFLALLALLAILAPILSPYDPLRLLGPETLKSLPPSREYWFGTDPLSRDAFSRLLYGTRISLRIALLAATLSGVVGLLWGATAGFFGGVLDQALMRTVDTLLAVPRVLLVLTVLSLWPEITSGGLVIVLGLTGWFGTSRLARAEALGIRSRDFVVAARALGVPRLAILARHVLPHAIGPVLVSTTVGVGHVLVLEAGLGFLGLGVRPPTPTWGSIIADGRETLQVTWWLTVFPGIALIGTSLAVNALANRLRMAINPRQLPGR